MTDDPFDALRRAGGRPTPTPEEEARALARLQAAIGDEQRRLVRRRVRRRWVISVGVATVAVMVAVGTLVQPRPARAVLMELAQAARVATPLDIPAGSFFYVRSERVDLAGRPGAEFGLDRAEVGFLLPTIREVWRNPAVRFIQIRTTVGTPQFFDQEAEDAYYALGLDQTDRIGETYLQQLTDAADVYVETDWPTDPEQLGQVIEAAVSTSDDQIPIEARLLGFAANLLRETNPSPQLRAAVLEVLADLPLELTDRRRDGSITIAVTYRNPLLTQDSITLSGDGQLLAEATTLHEPNRTLKIPEGTRISTANYQPPTPTDSLDAPLWAD